MSVLHPWGADPAADLARRLANLRQTLAAVGNSDDLPGVNEAIRRLERAAAESRDPPPPP